MTKPQVYQLVDLLNSVAIANANAGALSLSETAMGMIRDLIYQITDEIPPLTPTSVLAQCVDAPLDETEGSDSPSLMSNDIEDESSYDSDADPEPQPDYPTPLVDLEFETAEARLLPTLSDQPYLDDSDYNPSREQHLRATYEGIAEFIADASPVNVYTQLPPSARRLALVGDSQLRQHAVTFLVTHTELSASEIQTILSHALSNGTLSTFATDDWMARFSDKEKGTIVEYACVHKPWCYTLALLAVYKTLQLLTVPNNDAILDLIEEVIIGGRAS